MSYVKANTAPTFGSRSQAVRPLRLGGWFNGPYPVYGQPASLRLNGEFSPPRASSGSAWDGMRTYRINPATGQYQFYTGDIRPRGIFPQNTFQHPQLSALGLQIRVAQPPSAVRSSLTLPAPNPSAITRARRGFARRQPNQRSRRAVDPRMSCGSSCHCGGRCKRLGDAPSDTFIDPNTGCEMDTDGNLLRCPGGIDPFPQSQSTVPLKPTIPDTSRSNAILTAIQAATGAATSVANAARGVQPPAPESSGLFSGNTNIGGYSVPNTVLFAGAGLLAIAALGRKRR